MAGFSGTQTPLTSTLLALILTSGSRHTMGGAMAQKSLPEAMDDLKATLRPVIVPPLERMLFWIDRQIQRSPRLYRWLSR